MDGMNSTIRLESGLDRLEEWSTGADQTEQNAVYEALFSVLDGSVFFAYPTEDDPRRRGEFFVRVRDDLVIKLRLEQPGSFGIAYVGAAAGAPGHELGRDRAA